MNFDTKIDKTNDRFIRSSLFLSFSFALATKLDSRFSVFICCRFSFRIWTIFRSLVDADDLLSTAFDWIYYAIYHVASTNLYLCHLWQSARMAIERQPKVVLENWNGRLLQSDNWVCLNWPKLNTFIERWKCWFRRSVLTAKAVEQHQPQPTHSTYNIWLLLACTHHALGVKETASWKLSSMNYAIVMRSRGARSNVSSYFGHFECSVVHSVHFLLTCTWNKVTESSSICTRIANFLPPWLTPDAEPSTPDGVLNECVIRLPPTFPLFFDVAVGPTESNDILVLFFFFLFRLCFVFFIWNTFVADLVFLSFVLCSMDVYFHFKNKLKIRRSNNEKQIKK